MRDERRWRNPEKTPTPGEQLWRSLATRLMPGAWPCPRLRACRPLRRRRLSLLLRHDHRRRPCRPCPRVCQELDHRLPCPLCRRRWVDHHQPCRPCLRICRGRQRTPCRRCHRRCRVRKRALRRRTTTRSRSQTSVRPSRCSRPSSAWRRSPPQSRRTRASHSQRGVSYPFRIPSNLDTHPSFSFSRHSRMQDKAGAGFRTEES